MMTEMTDQRTAQRFDEQTAAGDRQQLPLRYVAGVPALLMLLVVIIWLARLSA